MEDFKIGQIYIFPQSWTIGCISIFTLPKDTLLKIENILTNGDMLFSYPSEINIPKIYLHDISGTRFSDDINYNHQGYLMWTKSNFQEVIKDGFAYNVFVNSQASIQSEEPKNNGKSDTCYWCGKPTTVLFEQLRICKKCNK